MRIRFLFASRIGACGPVVKWRTGGYEFTRAAFDATVPRLEPLGFAVFATRLLREGSRTVPAECAAALPLPHERGARAYTRLLVREQVIDQQPETGHGKSRPAPDVEN